MKGRGKIAVYLRGASDEARGNDHRASLRLNGIQLPGSVTWNSNAQAILRAEFDQALLGAAVNGLIAMDLQVDGKILAGETYSLFMIDRVEVDYYRKMRAHHGGVWVRDVAAGIYAVDGLGSKAVKVIENPGTTKAKWRKDVKLSPDSEGGWQVSFKATEKADYLIAPREMAQSAAALAAYRANDFATEIV